MPILNSIYKGRNLFASEFFCPHCHTYTRYQIKPISDALMFYTIPVFDTNNLTHVVECRVCKNGFELDILKTSNQSLFKLIAATKKQLLDGTSPGSLKIRLMSDGLKEEFVNKLIALAQM